MLSAEEEARVGKSEGRIELEARYRTREKPADAFTCRPYTRGVLGTA